MDTQESYQHPSVTVPLAAAAEPPGEEVSTEPSTNDQAATIPEDNSCTGGKEYDPYSFNKEMARLDELNKTLMEVKQRLNQVSMRSLMLNVDVVTQFDPRTAESLSKVVQDCEACIARVREMDKQEELPPSPQTASEQP